MSCFSPLVAFYSRHVNPSGKRSLVWNRNLAFGAALPVIIPCGHCCGCRISRARQWAVRCMHEASLYLNNCFVTFTFSPEHLDSKGSLRKEDFVLFMKRLRKKFGNGIRFFHCGEYGTKLRRPHHHAILFNCDFPDKVPCGMSNGYQMYKSETLNKLWGKGFCSIGSVTFESAGYIARYHLKKVSGDDAEDHYGDLVPEYITMSNRGGIGKGWYDKYKSDVYPSDLVVLPGNRKLKPPKYYDKLLEREDPSLYTSVKAARKEYALNATVQEAFSWLNSQYDDDGKLQSPRTIAEVRRSIVFDGYCCSERLSIRERVQLYKLDKLKRGYEDVDRETFYCLRC